jgi:hypothetical protein
VRLIIRQYVTEEGEFEDTEPFVVNTYKGSTSDGKPAAFTIDYNSLFGIILGENYHYIIRSANDYTQNSGNNGFIVYKSWDIIPDDSYTDYINDVLEIPDDVTESLVMQDTPVTSQSMPLTRAVPTRSIKIATEADYEFYSKLGANSYDSIISIINAANLVYVSTFGISLYITQQFVQTASSQPYTSTNASTLLNSFRDYWNANRTNVDRHIAHLFTGKTLGITGGMAKLGGFNNSNAYALSVDRTNMYQTTTHEIGHNLNAQHPSDGSCGTPSASVMCQGIKNSNLWFSPQSINEINTFLSNRSSSLVYILGTSAITQYIGNYSLQNAPSGTVTWAVTGPLYVSPVTGSTTSVSQTGSSGSGTLTAKVNGTVVATKSITVSSPALGPITGPRTVSRGSTYVSFRVQNNSYVPGLTFTWGSSGTLVLVSNNGGEEGLFNVPSNTQGSTSDTVHCTVKTSNGTTVGVFYMNVTIM